MVNSEPQTIIPLNRAEKRSSASFHWHLTEDVAVSCRKKPRYETNFKPLRGNLSNQSGLLYTPKLKESGFVNDVQQITYFAFR